MQPVVRSSIRTINVSGPNRDPWGIDSDSMTQLEKASHILTRCWRSIRNEQIQLIRMSGTPKLISLRTTVEWSTWSKALAKSTNNKRTDFLLSRAEFQWCNISIKACVVDFPRKQPNYLRSSLLSVISRIQRETNDSSTLDSDAVREIGLM